MDEDRVKPVDEFINGNGDDYYITDVEDLTRPAWYDSFTVIEVE